MRKNILMIMAVALLAAWTPARSEAAGPQEAKKEQTKQEPTAKGTLQSSEKKDESFYRVDYVVSELDHGKRTNVRNFTLKVKDGERSSFHVGNQIPIAAAGGGFQYRDVGVRIDTWVKPTQDSGVSVSTRMEISSVAEPATTQAPITRSFSLEDNSLVEPGKPTLIGGIDDAASDRRYEVEVTVTKVK